MSREGVQVEKERVEKECKQRIKYKESREECEWRIMYIAKE